MGEEDVTLTCVEPHVRFQVVIAREPLPALLALERLLSRVRPSKPNKKKPRNHRQRHVNELPNWIA